jgi:protein-disulfide isomerase
MNRSIFSSFPAIRVARRAASWAFIGSALASSPTWAGNEASGSSSSASQPVIAVIGQQRIGESDVIAAYSADFDRLNNDSEMERRHLELKLAKSRHDLLQQDLDKMLDRDALDMEAKSRGIRTDQVLAGLKLTTPTEEEARAFYEANRERIKLPYEEVAPKVMEYLATQRNQGATRGFYDALRAKHGINSTLAPYREAVADSGPARGASTARVTIVEFGDFQCPYCRDAEASLRTIMAHHPQEVRVVFRNLPLTQIHPDAKTAAEAGICADRQGKFWEMHDAMYDDQSKLSTDALKNTAARLGLDAQLFAACLADPRTSEALGADAEAARDLGLEGTPYFFINGRPIDGSVPVEKFERVIADELHQPARDRS